MSSAVSSAECVAWSYECVVVFGNCEFIHYCVILGSSINMCRLFKDMGSNMWFVYSTQRHGLKYVVCLLYPKTWTQICGLFALPKDMDSNMWFVCSTQRHGLRYVVCLLYPKTWAQICGLFALPKDMGSNMWFVCSTQRHGLKYVVCLL